MRSPDETDAVMAKIEQGICPTCGGRLKAKEIAEGDYISRLGCKPGCGFVLWSSKLYTEWFVEKKVS